MLNSLALFFPLLKKILIINYVGVCMWVCEHEAVWLWRPEEDVRCPGSEATFDSKLSYVVLGTELMSSERVVCILNHQAMSSAFCYFLNVEKADVNLVNNKHVYIYVFHESHL